MGRHEILYSREKRKLHGYKTDMWRLRYASTVGEYNLHVCIRSLRRRYLVILAGFGLTETWTSEPNTEQREWSRWAIQRHAVRGTGETRGVTAQHVYPEGAYCIPEHFIGWKVNMANMATHRYSYNCVDIKTEQKTCISIRPSHTVPLRICYHGEL